MAKDVQSKRVEVELVEPVHLRLSMCKSHAGLTHSQMVDEALSAWMEREGLTYEELVNRQLAVVIGRGK